MESLGRPFKKVSTANHVRRRISGSVACDGERARPASQNTFLAGPRSQGKGEAASKARRTRKSPQYTLGLLSITALASDHSASERLHAAARESSQCGAHPPLAHVFQRASGRSAAQHVRRKLMEPLWGSSMVSSNVKGVCRSPSAWQRSDVEVMSALRRSSVER